MESNEHHLPSFKTTCGIDVSMAADYLRDGLVVSIPTETVYGLACNAFDEKAVAEVFRLKNRPFFDPLIVHVSRRDAVYTISQEISTMAIKLMDAFWPGPLTLLLPKSPSVPDLVTSGLDTVAIRMPSHPLALELLSKLDFPLAAPSANPFGYVSPTSAHHVLQHFSGLIPYILDGGACEVGIESTIVGFEGVDVVVYRLGGISVESLKAVVGNVVVKSVSSSKPSAPGMLKSHYAPHAPLRISNFKEFALNHDGSKAAFISFMDEFVATGVDVFILSKTGNDVEAARNLFKVMRLIDDAGYGQIVAEKMPDRGLCRAINDRLSRAAHPKHT
jgi:L-threonylcarbamoyladenylate synthase